MQPVCLENGVEENSGCTLVANEDELASRRIKTLNVLGGNSQLHEYAGADHEADETARMKRRSVRSRGE
jgi:hypothetical protein